MLTKYVSCKCKCKFDGRKCNSNQKWNTDKWQCECKKLHVKDYIWNPGTCSWEYDKHFATIIDNSVITCNEIIDAKAKSCDEETKTVPTNFNEKKCNL